jgi:hypothetical protein
VRSAIYLSGVDVGAFTCWRRTSRGGGARPETIQLDRRLFMVNEDRAVKRG